MKKIFTLVFLISCFLNSFSQTFPGYRSGNYTGVNGVFFNPANIADSRYRWDVNLFSIHAGIANNNASFKLKNINDIFGTNADSFLTKTNKTTNGAINLDLMGPSFMFNINKKTSIAITSRVRAMANVLNLDGNYIGNIKNNIDESLPLTLGSNRNQKLSINGWTDLGVSLGRVLYNNGKHFLKGGITLKYLAGSGNSYANINGLKATIDKDASGDVYVANASGTASVGYAGIDFDNFEAKDALKFNGHGAGGDIGFVYEYRPNAELTERYQNKYKLKLGISLLDIGSIKYKPKPDQHGSYTVNVSNLQQWYPDDFDGKSASEIKTYLDGSPYFTNNTKNLSSYKVSLPTNLQLNADYAVVKNFYLELATQLNLAKKGNLYNSFYYNAISFTPRYEGKHFGVYLPLNYNELSHFNAGISFRLGPVFFGSGSVITALVDKSKQADFHLGVNIGSLFKKPRKHKTKEIPEPTVTVTKPADSDNDGINDDQDKCPQTQGVMKYNGCPIPDADGDGVNDEADKCPQTPGVAKYYGCPVPDIDSDGDGVKDEEDKCPQIAGVAKYDGCPIPDTDGDGVSDEEDKCPLVPGAIKYNGCPIPDTDGDGVNDEEDKCPAVVGIAANKGCPAIKEEVIKKMAHEAKKIYFVSGKYALLSKSFLSLDEIAALLNKNPDLHLEIEGYTDNSGKTESNQLLSVKRALAVKNYLTIKGINGNRISCTGYGHTKPIADNKTAVGRTQNRRVELKLNY